MRSVSSQPSFTCPDCRKTSYSPGDIANSYCGACRAFKPDVTPGSTEQIRIAYYALKELSGLHWGRFEAHSSNTARARGEVCDDLAAELLEIHGMTEAPEAP